jgi:hypothetical protein
MWSNFDETKKRLDQLAETLDRLHSEAVQVKIIEDFLRPAETSPKPQALDSEDRRKLHAEINQIANQRFLLSTAGVTVFGVALTWLVPKDVPAQSFMRTAYAVSTLLTSLLLVLFWLSHRFRLLLRTYSTYLIVRKASLWELDWQKFRQEGYPFFYTRSHAALFLLLGLFTGLAPLAIAKLHSLCALEPMAGFTISMIATGFYSLAVGYFGFSESYGKRIEQRILERWEQVVSRDV